MKIYNRTQRSLFLQTFNTDPHSFEDAYMTVATGKFEFDCIKFDDWCAETDSEYDSENCLYKGKEASLEDYLTLKYGSHIRDLVADLIDGQFDRTIYNLSNDIN